MPKPMWRDSSCRMYWQIWRRSGSFELSASIRKRATAKVSATSCSPMVLIVQRRSPSIVSNSSFSKPGSG